MYMLDLSYLFSDSGKRYGNQSRRSWQVPEHDGLLGSGSFPRPSGYAAGASAPKVRPNEHYQLNKSSEPYQPPRPYKVCSLCDVDKSILRFQAKKKMFQFQSRIPIVLDLSFRNYEAPV